MNENNVLNYLLMQKLGLLSRKQLNIYHEKFDLISIIEKEIYFSFLQKENLFNMIQKKKKKKD